MCIFRPKYMFAGFFFGPSFVAIPASCCACRRSDSRRTAWNAYSPQFIVCRAPARMGSVDSRVASGLNRSCIARACQRFVNTRQEPVRLGLLSSNAGGKHACFALGQVAGREVRERRLIKRHLTRCAPDHDKVFSHSRLGRMNIAMFQHSKMLCSNLPRSSSTHRNKQSR